MVPDAKEFTLSVNSRKGDWPEFRCAETEHWAAAGDSVAQFAGERTADWRKIAFFEMTQQGGHLSQKYEAL